MATPDPRLGYRDGSFIITDYPTQYSDGTAFSKISNPTPTFLFLDDNYFCVLKAGVSGISDALEDELVDASGGTTTINFDDYANFLRILDLDANDVLTYEDDFIGTTLNGTWAIDKSTETTAALLQTAGASSLVVSTTGVDENYGTLALGLKWLMSKQVTLFEALLKVSAITEVIVEVGLNDSLTESGGTAFTSHDGTPVAVTSNAVLFGFHNATAGDTLTNWSALSVKAGGGPQRTDTTIALIADTYVKLAIAVDASGNAAFYVNDVKRATHANAIATSAYVTPYISLKTKTATNKAVTIDYVRISGNR